MPRPRLETPAVPLGERLAWRVDELAAMCGVSRSALYAEIQQGRLRASRIGRSGLIVTREQWSAFVGRAEVPRHLAAAGGAR